MAQQVQKTGILSKVALVILALSFPVGLFVLNAPALKELIPTEKRQDIAVDIEKVIEAKGAEIAKIDMQILEAKGELLKYEEMKISQLRELKILYDRIATMLGGQENNSDMNNLISK
jgi:hypothetical protein